MTLDEALRSANGWSLDALLLLLAVSVIIGSAWQLALRSNTPTPLDAPIERSQGGWAIGIIFFVSGQLISSLSKRSGTVRCLSSRTRQVCRALSATFLITSIIGIACGSVAPFHEVIAWCLGMFSINPIEHRFSEVLATNPLPNVANGPFLYLVCGGVAYGVSASIVWVTVLRNTLGWAALLTLVVSGGHFFGLLPERLNVFAPLCAALAFGMAVNPLREHILEKFCIVIIGLCLIGLLPWQPAIALTGLIAASVFTNWLMVKLGSAASFGLKFNAWPLSQTTVHLSPGATSAASAVPKVLFSIPLTYLSSLLVEQPRLGADRVML